VLYLIRHAKAGSRAAYKGDDRVRPLSGPGRRQAKALATRLAPLLKDSGVTTFYSSPFIRCIETLRPLATAIGADIEADDRLGEGQSYVSVLDMLWSLPDGTALCSHGDVIPETMGALERRGCEFTSHPDWRKASVWVLQRNDHGEIVSAEAWPPPDADQ
jgi:8-oxo-dGTP diphosphatase